MLATYLEVKTNQQFELTFKSSTTLKNHLNTQVMQFLLQNSKKQIGFQDKLRVKKHIILTYLGSLQNVSASQNFFKTVCDVKY